MKKYSKKDVKRLIKATKYAMHFLWKTGDAHVGLEKAIREFKK